MTDASLAVALREATATLHRRAERAGMMGRLLAGKCDAMTYCTLLHNLRALYRALERALDVHRAHPAIAPIREPLLYRGTAIDGDLAFLSDAAWPEMHVEDVMREYVERIDAVAGGQTHLLAAHAYVRYLGDLGGGAILREVVRKQFALEGSDGTLFYDFGDAHEADRLAKGFREGLDRIPLHPGERAAIVAEARRAFAAHVRLFEALDRVG